MDCNICKGLEKPVYKNKELGVFIPKSPTATGHIVVATLSHQKFEDVKDVNSFFSFGNTASVILFEGMKAQGTNIIMRSNEHASLDILPRVENDGLNFQWQPKKLSDKDMDKAASAIKDEAFYIGKEKKEETIEVPKVELKEKDEYDYTIKQLRRIP
jgi:diadenosine tetraphosphate (Ap4A) HIT family hydrolase